MRYSFPRIAGLDCPQGWEPQWDPQNQEDVCTAFAQYNAATETYALTYEQVVAIANNHVQPALSATSQGGVEVGDMVALDERAMRIGGLQAIYFARFGKTLDERAKYIANRLLGPLLENRGIIVHLSGSGGSTRLLQQREKRVMKYLMDRGVLRDQIFIVDRRREEKAVRATLYRPLIVAEPVGRS